MLSLYRRHRPKTFDEVVGQEPIVRTLRNAIELGKVHHAYLFVGSRGTGKTSMAKLLAAALNAEGGPSADFDPSTPMAQAILSGSSLDVVEMDAASHNSVDDVRELRENVALAPIGGGRRVYILDEAHMLSTAAWNAFLKTLEEPPAHVVFVLATTEAHKVPATIIDRCHRFDFQRPSLEQIRAVLKRASEAEGIDLPDAAASMIAREATGSFRDALGTLEQLVTYGGNEVKLDDVLEILGAADATLVLDAAEAIADRDARAALACVSRLADSGRDYMRFTGDLTGHLAYVLKTQQLGEPPETFAVTSGEPDRVAAQAERLAAPDILRAVDLLAAAIAHSKEGSEPRIQLELALLKATQPQADASLQALMYRLEQLERRVGGGGSAAAPEAPRAAEPEPPQAAAAPVATVASPQAGAGGGAAAAVAEPQEQPAPEGAVLPDLDLDKLRELWPAVTDTVRGANEMVGALLAEARPAALEDGRLTVAFAEGAAFLKKKAESNRALLDDALRGLTGRTFAVAYELREMAGDPGAPASAGLSEDELVARLRDEFGAEEVFEDEPETERRD
jgi:DNA polymerase-3 subunit gamma/tau